MFGGGLALAGGMQASGLTDWLGEALLSTRNTGRCCWWRWRWWRWWWWGGGDRIRQQCRDRPRGGASSRSSSALVVALVWSKTRRFCARACLAAPGGPAGASCWGPLE